MNTLLAKVVVGAASFLALAAPAQAASLVLDFQTAPDGTRLDANALDSADGQIIGGQTYSTSLGNVGEIFSPLGIDITVSGTSAPLGLFNSACVPTSRRGRLGSNNVGTGPCGENNNLGDNDLATGYGFNPFGEEADANGINFDTAPQGNLIILEENAGNGTPDDTGSGGTITFDINSDLIARATLQEFIFVDDARGTIALFFENGDVQEESFRARVENDLLIFGTDFLRQESLTAFSVSFDGSGGLGAVVFSEFTPSGAVPEGETVLGLVAAVGLFGLRKKLKS